MEELFAYMNRQLALLTSTFVRYIYPDIKWENRMLGLVGPRGVGKTTLFLQHIKNHCDPRRTLYVTADHMYFSTHTLYDMAGEFNRAGGTHLFIDEVHKYDDWSGELKAIYDAYPDMHVAFTGSSVLDIEKGRADLSRRAPTYTMQGLSFREFLAIRHGIEVPAYSLDEIVDNRAVIPDVAHPLPLFREYLQRGYYPFGSDPDFETELDQVIARTLEVDIPQFANMNVATGRRLKRLLAVVSTLAPFQPNMTSLGSQIQASRNNVEDYLVWLEKAGMIAQLRTGAGGLGALGKVDKVYLDNPNILFALSRGHEEAGTVRETFFFNQTRVRHDVTSSAISDFEVEGMTVEVGGKSKSKRQIKEAERGIIAKDDIESGWGNVVPLWAFGLEY